MALVVTSRVKIGEGYRSPGYILTDEDCVGRNIDAMKKHGHIKWVDDDTLTQHAPKARKASLRDED